MKLAIIGAAFVIIISTVPAIACIKSNDAMDVDRFNRADVNEDGKLDYEEALNFRKHELANAKENAPNLASQFVGRNFFGRNYPDNYELNEQQFKTVWEEADTDKNGHWSFEEFKTQVLTKRCEA